jgi:hypothetical protein
MNGEKRKRASEEKEKMCVHKEKEFIPRRVADRHKDRQPNVAWQLATQIDF